MRIAIASDHGGFSLKTAVIKAISGEFSVEDLGPATDAPCDYPDSAIPVAKAVASGKADFGILVCRSGIGMSMAANKHRGIRAAACSDTFSARLTRVHNDANVLCFGERVVGIGLALDLVDAFVDAEFEGGKHQRRVDMITQIEISESNA